MLASSTRTRSPGPCPPAQLGRRLLRALGVHQARFSYSPMGALRWKRDLSEYAALASGPLRQPAGSPVAQQLEEMQAGGGSGVEAGVEAGSLWRCATVLPSINASINASIIAPPRGPQPEAGGGLEVAAGWGEAEGALARPPSQGEWLGRPSSRPCVRQWRRRRARLLFPLGMGLGQQQL